MKRFNRLNLVMLTCLFFVIFLLSGCNSSGADKVSETGKIVTLRSLAVTSDDQDIAPGATLQFSAEGTYSDNTTKDLTSSVVWESSDTDVVTINNKGLATAMAEGTATVTATSDDIDISGSVQLTVTATATPPLAPGGFSASAGDGQVTLSWDIVPEATSYNIYWSVLPGITKTTGTKISNVTSPYIHSGRTNGTPYYYRVTAANSYGESDESGQISATPSHSTPPSPPATSAIIIDHTSTKLADIPLENINQAKTSLHIAYGHTSHGSQIVTGMSGLYSWKGSLYAFNDGGTGSALDLRDTPFSRAYDLGNPDRTSWASSTRTYLDANPDINVIIWSWCGEVSWATQADINTYLSLMAGLETDYPAVKFVYMTGHLDGSGLTENLHLRNEQIRKYCRDNNKILYDFEDIESYNPDGTYFGDKIPNDACDYDSNSDGTQDANWASQWQNAHTQGVDWFDCSAAHSQPLNGNLKAYAAWWLWARLAGWSGN
jgi:hypothetical protein